MTAEITPRELLSEWMDGEASAIHSDQTLRKLMASEEQQDDWQRYHVYGDVLRGEESPLCSDFAAKIAAQITAEPTVLAPRMVQQNNHKRFRQPLFGAAVAASVAVASVLAVALSQEDTTALSGTLKPALANTKPLDININAPVQFVSATHWQQLQSPQMQARLNRYSMERHEQTAAGKYQDTAPYASFVSYGQQ
ncbi:MAG: sigma-E factor negative regulatory protein [gamma proteobacterium symbiont of Bathyaustriella thionipta]|nr:sigma-E factor negative regulatory protein [gamma proteobacterium symbiont of Bathyaustriella thionipta]